MAAGDPGKEQFSNMQTKMRNGAIILYLSHTFLMREEFVNNDEMGVRSGFDDATQRHLLDHLNNVDAWRRRITHNPDKRDIKALTEESRKLSGSLEDDKNETSPSSSFPDQLEKSK